MTSHANPKAFRQSLAQHRTASAGPVAKPCVAVRLIFTGQVCLLFRMGVRPYVRSRAGASQKRCLPCHAGKTRSAERTENDETPTHQYRATVNPPEPRSIPHLPCVAGQAMRLSIAPARERTLGRTSEWKTKNMSCRHTPTSPHNSSVNPARPRSTPHLPCVAGQAMRLSIAPARERTHGRTSMRKQVILFV